MTLVDTNLFIYAVGRAFENGFCEHLWRSVKYKNIYVNQCGAVRMYFILSILWFSHRGQPYYNEVLKLVGIPEEATVSCSQPGEL